MASTATAARFTVEGISAQLRGTLEAVAWAASLIPDALTRALPHWYPPDAWTAAMNLAHMVVYEERVALPILEAIEAGGDGTVVADHTTIESWFLSDAQAISGEPLEALVARLRRARERQAAIAVSLGDERLNRPVSPRFSHFGEGLRSPGWILTKTWQHTWEHGNSILRIALVTPR